MLNRKMQKWWISLATTVYANSVSNAWLIVMFEAAGEGRVIKPAHVSKNSVAKVLEGIRSRAIVQSFYKMQHDYVFT